MTDTYVWYMGKLEGEYKDTFKKIEVYVNANNLDSQSQEELMHSLLDTFLLAQEEKRSVEKITGKNLERFCREFCSGYGIKERLLSFFEYSIPMIICFFIVSIMSLTDGMIKYSEGTISSIWTYSDDNVELISFFIGLILAFFIDFGANYITKKIMFKLKKVTMRFLFAVRFILLTLVIVCMLVFSFFLPDELGFSLAPSWISSLIFLCLIILYLAVTRKRRKNSIYQAAGFEDIYGEDELIKNVIYYEKNHYFKLNEKYAKKGKPQLTQEEYIEKEIKDWKRLISPSFYIILPILLTFAEMTVQFTFLEGFESISDFFISVAVMLAIQYLIMLGWYKVLKKSVPKRLKWLENEKEHPVVWTKEEDK